MKTIVVAGFYRTGSTWLFNAVKTVIQCAGFTTCQTGEGFAPENTADYCIHKVHTWFPDLACAADAIFTSTRDLEQVFASYERLTGHEMPKEYFIECHAEFMLYQSHSNYCMEFTDLETDKRKVINRIISVLGLKACPEAVLNKVNAIKPPEEGQDLESYYFHNHITRKPSN